MTTRGTKRIVAALLVMGIAAGAYAVDRDASMIGSANMDFESYKDMNSVRFTAWHEVALNNDRDWALVAGIAYGQMKSSGQEAQELWFGALGVKWYPWTTTGISLLGVYESTESGDNYRLSGGTLGIEQRFLTQSTGISPYIVASATMQSSRVVPWSASESFTSLVMRGGIGCDVILTEDLTVVFQGVFVDSSAFRDNPNSNYADGWSGTIALKYYWMQ